MEMTGFWATSTLAVHCSASIEKHPACSAIYAETNRCFLEGETKWKEIYMAIGAELRATETFSVVHALTGKAAYQIYATGLKQHHSLSLTAMTPASLACVWTLAESGP